MDRSFKQFLTLPISRDFVAILAWKVEAAVGRPGGPSLAAFARSLIVNSRIQPSTLFGAMVYLERLGERLAATPCAPHRVLLASLVLAGKFLNDSSPKNRHWASYSQLFSVADVNRIEAQCLALLDYRLAIATPELLAQYQSFLHLPHPPKHPRNHFIVCYIPALPPKAYPPRPARQHPYLLKPRRAIKSTSQ